MQLLFAKLTLLPVAMFIVSAAAQGAALKPFAHNDEWTFVQSRSGPGITEPDNEIRLSFPLAKKQNGDLLLTVVTAVTAKGEVIRKPIGMVPAGVCLRDFLGRSNLGLANSCQDGLAIGAHWQNRSEDDDGEENIQFLAAGDELVTTPAGTFKTIKIEGLGERTSPRHPAESVVVRHWFCPQAKAMVRTTREYRSADGALVMKITEDLTALKVN